MIVSIVSKKGGTGCTTLTLTLGNCLNKEHGKSVCVLDLKTNNDTRKLLNINSKASVSNLITSYGVYNTFTSIEENVVNIGGISVIPSVAIPYRSYLCNKISRIKELLIELEKRYNYVLIDMEDSEAYSLLRKNGVETIPVNVLEQNILVASEYSEEMKNGSLQGYVIVNKLDNEIFPKEDFFKKYFGNNSVHHVAYSKDIKSIVNEKGFSIKEISKTRFYQDVVRFCNVLINDTSSNINVDYEYEEDDNFDIFETPESSKPNRQNKPKKVSFFSKLFGKGGSR